MYPIEVEPYNHYQAIHSVLFQIQNLRSNINYFLKVRVSDGENVGNFTEEILARTGKNSSGEKET